MASYPRTSSLTSLADMRLGRRMSAPVPATARRSSQASVPGSAGWRSSSCDDSRPRRLSLADISAARSSRKLSLVQCSTSSDSVEIDTSSLSYDLPAAGASCAGSYQPIPRDAAIRHSPVLLTHITTNRSCYVVGPYEWDVLVTCWETLSG
jgi:hypothetical protein